MSAIPTPQPTTDHSVVMDAGPGVNQNSAKYVRPKTRSSKQKTKKSSTPDENKRKIEMEEKIRKRVALEEKAFRLVEQLLENPITEQFLIDAGQYITPDHYHDVVEERSISSTCGYPLCSKPLRNVLKQKFHISTANNKVYDITDRKKFCSSQCYKASQYYEQQISSAPVWTRDTADISTINLLPANCSSGKIGEAVINPPELGIRQVLQELDRADRRATPRKPDTGVVSARLNKPDTPKSQVDSGLSLSCEGHSIGTVHRRIDDPVLARNHELRGGIPSSQDQVRFDISLDLAELRIDLDAPAETRKETESVLLADLVDNIARVHVGEHEEEIACLGHDPLGETQSREGCANDSQPTSANVNQTVSTQDCTQTSPKKSSPFEADFESRRACLMDNVELFSPRTVPLTPAKLADLSCEADAEGDRATSTKTEILPDKAESVQNDSGLNSGQSAIDRRDGDGNSPGDTKSGDIDTSVMGSERSLDSASQESSVLSETEENKKQTLIEFRATTPSACETHPSYVAENSSTTSADFPEHAKVSGEGEKTKQTAIAVTQQKTALLMELLDKRDCLRQKGVTEGVQTSSTGSTGAKDCHPTNKLHSKNVVGRRKFVACIDDYSVPENGTALSSRDAHDTSSDKHQLNASSILSEHSSSKNPPKLSKEVAKSSPGTCVTSKSTGVSTKPKTTKRQTKKPKVTPLDLMRQTLFDWKTVDTVKLLQGPDQSKAHTDSFEEKCAALSRRVDAQDMSEMIDEVDIDEEMGKGKLPSMQQLEKDAEGYQVMVKEFYGSTTHMGDVNACLPGNRGDISKHEASGTIKEHTEKQVLLPLVDSLSQLTHRRKIVLDKLSRVFPELLGPLRISIADVSGDLKLLIKTFNLTSSNILLKPAEWTLMAYFLLKLLSGNNASLQQSLRGDVATHYFRTMLLSLNISETEVAKVVTAMCTEIGIE